MVDLTTLRTELLRHGFDLKASITQALVDGYDNILSASIRPSEEPAEAGSRTTDKQDG